MSKTEKGFDKRRERFFSLVGYAISRWAYVDRGLFDFCLFALGTSEKKTAIVFYRSQTIGEHLALTHALMIAAQLQDRHLAQWSRIYGKIDKLLPFRNDIAHNPPVQRAQAVVHMSADPSVPGRLGKSSQWWAIETESKKLLHPSKRTREGSASETELLEHIRSVYDLEGDMHDLSWSLIGPPRGVNPTLRRPYVPPKPDPGGSPNSKRSRRPIRRKR